jgi:predicted transcriptional regulator
MTRLEKTRSASAKMNRSETVSIRLDPRLNYLCELAARSQRRTKSSFIEAAIDQKINEVVINTWRDMESASIGERADDLWHVRDHERLIALGIAAPHLMTFEEQEIWAVICETGHFWRGQWVDDGDRQRWDFKPIGSALVRNRVKEEWEKIIKAASGEEDRSSLPISDYRAKIVPAGDLDDEIPF